jgi:hypothetical protein
VEGGEGLGGENDEGGVLATDWHGSSRIGNRRRKQGGRGAGLRVEGSEFKLIPVGHDDGGEFADGGSSHGV